MIWRTLRGVPETELLGGAIASWLEPNDVVALDGPMGAGKTTLTAAIVKELGIREPVRSPTYTLANVYQSDDGLTIAHIDLYRDSGALTDEAWWADIQPTIEQASFTIVEWPKVGLQHLRDRITLEVMLGYGLSDPAGFRTVRLNVHANQSRRTSLARRSVAWSGMTEPVDAV
jgi:tRNA threonylcarbamoyladenosine biosynthesis protein TsaE